jgi:uracil-DNA glycosylase
MSTGDEQRRRLTDLEREIRSTVANCWLFPAEDRVLGFRGNSPLMFVGDQPSMNEWGERDRGRRLFYGKLLKYGLGDAHLTDVYKARGKSGALEGWRHKGMPPDWQTVHKPFFERELDIINPDRIICIGWRAFELIDDLMPTCASRTFQMMHFAEGVKPGRLHQFEVSLQIACGICSTSNSSSAISRLKEDRLSDTFVIHKYYCLGQRLPTSVGGQQEALYLTLKAASADGSRWLTEDAARRAVISSKYLNTSQDPWRIWEYYRRELVNHQAIIEHVIAEL